MGAGTVCTADSSAGAGLLARGQTLRDAEHRRPKALPNGPEFDFVGWQLRYCTAAKPLSRTPGDQLLENMPQGSAHRQSFWQAAGRAWVKQLARTTIGGKVLRAAYESHFEAAGGYETDVPRPIPRLRVRPPLRRLLGSRSVTTATPRRPGERMSGVTSSRATIRCCSGLTGCFPRRKCCSTSAAISGVVTSHFGSS